MGIVKLDFDSTVAQAGRAHDQTFERVSDPEYPSSVYEVTTPICGAEISNIVILLRNVLVGCLLVDIGLFSTMLSFNLK